MAKKKPNKRKKAIKGFPLIEDKCLNDEQAESALVYAVRSFNKYFEDGIIVVKVKDDKYKVVTFGPGDPKDHFKPVMWQAIKAAYEAYKEGPNESDTFEG
jgi:hypothetical protein